MKLHFKHQLYTATGPVVGIIAVETSPENSPVRHVTHLGHFECSEAEWLLFKETMLKAGHAVYWSFN